MAKRVGEFIDWVERVDSLFRWAIWAAGGGAALIFAGLAWLWDRNPTAILIVALIAAAACAIIWRIIAKEAREKSRLTGGTNTSEIVENSEMFSGSVPKLNRALYPYDWSLNQVYAHWANATDESGAFSEELENAAHHGLVAVWGKRGFSETAVMEAITPEYWVHARISMHPVLYSSSDGVSEEYILENSTTQPRNQHDTNLPRFWQLKMSSTEIRKLWPAASI